MRPVMPSDRASFTLDIPITSVNHATEKKALPKVCTCTRLYLIGILSDSPGRHIRIQLDSRGLHRHPWVFVRQARPGGS